MTVREALIEYMVDYKAEGKKAESTTQYTIDAHILPTFGDTRISDLESPAIRKWHRDLVTAPLRKRGGTMVEIDLDDPEVLRKRRASANRILTVLKAGLNFVFGNDYLHKEQNDLAWRRISAFKEVNPDPDDIRWLSVKELRRLANACPSDLRTLVEGASHTGARYGELRRLQVRDFANRAITIRYRVGKT
ncbi:MAG: site-specific integrase, partial [Nitrospinae bacterium]|nr:site-specific integrase [Nitrospinota bacterium]